MPLIMTTRGPLFELLFSFEEIFWIVVHQARFVKEWDITCFDCYLLSFRWVGKLHHAQFRPPSLGSLVTHFYLIAFLLTLCIYINLYTRAKQIFRAVHWGLPFKCSVWVQVQTCRCTAIFLQSAFSIFHCVQFLAEVCIFDISFSFPLHLNNCFSSPHNLNLFLKVPSIWEPGVHAIFVLSGS